MRPGVVIEDITEQEAGAPQAGAQEEAQQPEQQEGEQCSPPAPTEGSGAAGEGGPDQQLCVPSGEEESGQAALERAEALKQEGNALYARGSWEAAMEKYSEALDAAPAGEGAVPQRAVYFANRAACLLKLERWADAAHDCSAALEANPGYTKVLLRRSTAYEELDDLERALADAQKVLELEPDNRLAAQIVERLEPVVMERREKLKEEMLGKLKELGNTVLGKFGLSIDNFKAEKDPATGSYSIKFSQG